MKHEEKFSLSLFPGLAHDIIAEALNDHGWDVEEHSPFHIKGVLNGTFSSFEFSINFKVVRGDVVVTVAASNMQTYDPLGLLSGPVKKLCDDIKEREEEVLQSLEEEPLPDDHAPKVFISYAREDAKFAQELSDSLYLHSILPWRDENALRTGDVWHKEIKSAIVESDAVVLIISPHAVTSTFVEKEIKQAQRIKKVILPVVRRPADFSHWFSKQLERTQFSDFSTGRKREKVSELASAIGRRWEERLRAEGREFDEP